MADAQRTIDLIFNGVDKTGAAVQSVLSNTSKFAGGVQNATQPIADFTAGALKFEAALLTAGAAITLFAVKTAGDFDTAFREISTLLNQPIEDLGEFRQAILDYASTSTAPLEQVTGAIYNAISAGVDFADSIDVVSRAEKLSVAGKADLNSSLLVLVSSLNAYGLGMEEAGRFSDVLFQAVRDGQTNLPLLAAGLSQVTGTAATLEVPFETLLAAIAALTKTGTPTQQAITQINAALAALIKPSKQASDLAAELGIEFGAQAVKAKGLDGVLQDVAKATGGNEEQMGMLFGSVEALRAVFPLTGKAASFFSEILGNMANAAGATDAAFAKMGDSIDISGQKIANAFKILLIGVGDPLLDEFGGIAEGIAAIFLALGANVAGGGGLGDVVAYVESIMGDLEQTIAEVARNLPAALAQADFSGFRNGIDAVVQAVKLLFSNIDLSTVDGLTVAIETAGAAFLGLSQFTAGVIESFKPLFDLLVDLGSGLASVDDGLFKTAGEFAGFVTQANLLAGGLNSLLPAIEALVGILILKQGASLVGALAAASAGLGGQAGLLALLISPKGLVAASGAAGVAVGTLANNLTEVATGSSLSTRLTDFLISIGAIDDEATNLANSLNDLPLPQTGASVADLDRQMLDLAGTAEDAGSRVFNFGTGLWEIDDSASSSAASLGDTVGTLLAYPSAVSGAAGALGTVEDGLNRVTDSAEDLSKAADSITLEEKLAIIAGQAQIAAAQIEADAVRISAAFESIGTTVTSTGELIGELFGQINDAPTLRDLFRIENQIEDENRRRDDALKLQQQLTRAELRLIDAKTNALRRGGALIQVDGAGLQPHLEAIMFELLAAIQVRVNAEGQEFLLGV
jgi:TP901 family phage tail tape measure protein